MKYDYLIVGAGLYGACFAWKKRQEGKQCLVIDKRPHLGGNLYCENVDGINVHKYGAHIFHTSNKAVWDFVNSIVPFNRYTNSPVANYQGQLYNLPFNMNTFYQMWGVTTPAQAKAKIEEQKAEALEEFTGHKAQGTLQHAQSSNRDSQPTNQNAPYQPRNLEEQALLLVGRDIYERLIKGYTEKQWGRPCSELPAFIIRRLPVRLVFDNNYFNDLYQGIPEGGYNRLIDGLLEGTDCRTGVDFFQDRAYFESLADRILFTGKIDEFYDYRFGHLQYRTVRFEEERLNVSNYQGNAVVNYTDRQVPYTRIIEHKHFEHFGPAVDVLPHTIISREYSTEWQPGMESYYPVNDERNTRLYQQYKALADSQQRVEFGGRLAEYKYYDMAPIVEKVIFG